MRAWWRLLLVKDNLCWRFHFQRATSFVPGKNPSRRKDNFVLVAILAAIDVSASTAMQKHLSRKSNSRNEVSHRVIKRPPLWHVKCFKRRLESAVAGLSKRD